MNKFKVNLGVLVLIISSCSLMACNTENKKSDTVVTTETQQAVGNTESKTKTVQQDHKASQIIAQYLVLKDALVGDNAEASAQASKKLLVTLDNFKADQFNSDEQLKLAQILENSKQQATQISTSDLAKQREQFLKLSENMLDLVAITGAPQQLYQQHCPMYNNNQGGSWLSAQKEIKNPYFGSSMLTCGMVQREI